MASQVRSSVGSGTKPSSATGPTTPQSQNGVSARAPTRMPEPEAIAIARALSAADNAGDESQWEMWMGFAKVVYEHFPMDYVILQRQEYKSLIRSSANADPDRGAIIDSLVQASRQVLADFLDPVARSVAMGQLAALHRQLGQYDWRNEDRNDQGR